MDASESSNNLLHHSSRRLLISGNAATRLYNSITSMNVGSNINSESLLSVCSSNELGHSCRICRWNQSGLQIQKCPCQCKGSVGYVHMKCLRRWILHRGDGRCEICGTMFDLSAEHRNYKQMFRSFFQTKYLGAILKNSIHIATLAPISYFILYQVLLIMDNLHLEDENNTLQIVFLAPALLVTSSLCGIIFFHILEFGLTRFLRIKSILRHWWTFGGQDSDSTIDMEVPSDFFEFL